MCDEGEDSKEGMAQYPECVVPLQIVAGLAGSRNKKLGSPSLGLVGQWLS